MIHGQKNGKNLWIRGKVIEVGSEMDQISGTILQILEESCIVDQQARPCYPFGSLDYWHFAICNCGCARIVNIDAVTPVLSPNLPYMSIHKRRHQSGGREGSSQKMTQQVGRNSRKNFLTGSKNLCTCKPFVVNFSNIN